MSMTSHRMMTSLENEHCHNFTTFFPFSVKFLDLTKTYHVFLALTY